MKSAISFNITESTGFYYIYGVSSFLLYFPIFNIKTKTHIVTEIIPDGSIRSRPNIPIFLGIESSCYIKFS